MIHIFKYYASQKGTKNWNQGTLDTVGLSKNSVQENILWFCTTSIQMKQGERTTKYVTPQGKYTYRELMRMGYQFEQIKKLPYIEVPRYSG